LAFGGPHARFGWKAEFASMRLFAAASYSAYRRQSQSRSQSRPRKL
jgi:hypothetical protein